MVVVDANAPDAKSDQQGAPGTTAPRTGSGAALIEILSGTQQTPGGQPINSIETIRIADAEIRFYDEANDSIWYIPQAELAFQRMPYGFAVAANADVSNGDEAGVWHADVSASYRRDTRSFSISTSTTRSMQARWAPTSCTVSR